MLRVIKSFQYAFAGCCFLLRTQTNAWVHLLATITLFIMCCFFSLSTTEVILLIIATTSVWVAEFFNTAVEQVIDLLHPQWHARAGRIKDLAAAAVLITALSAIAVATFIFIPKIIH
ncbi:MAG: diacylglycerol kinase family protein [Chitinophagaceae bacterium]|nr:diacylglycerol kinase family protein [Chitinophagaceae bacterium]